MDRTHVARVQPLPASIGARYRVLAQLGRGGSAHVYKVQEVSSGRELALKRLRDDLTAARGSELKRHLEREFYALAQLRHPRVIEVYDYGVSEGLPYYTMELLDGGDLRSASPLPWRRACELIYDVASSLALLHSRRFVHRDVTPSNIRCTRDGRAKLIDFGAMVQMGMGAQVVGTPAYVAPEVQQRGVLDACTDLFSLGATLYFTLTGHTAFSAVDLAAMPAAWTVPPLPPSQQVPEIPAGLDALLLSLLSIDPALRPRSAAEVMQRLAALAGLSLSESAHVSQGYLSAPHVVGREAALRSVRSHVQRALSGVGASLLIEAESGVGRSRLLELCALEAKTTGANVLRLDANGGEAAFAGAKRLAHALLACAPELARALLPSSAELNALLANTHEAVPAASRPALQEALTQWLLALSAQQTLVLAVDDVQRVDEPTLAWLAALAHAAPRTRLLLILTVERGARDTRGLAVLQRHSTISSVQPLTRGESDTMLASVFGCVPNLALLSERIFNVAAGNPHRSLTLAQYLIDQGQINYTAGAWSLPDEIPLDALSLHTEDLLAARIARLGVLARTLAETQALSLVAALRRDDYRELVPNTDARSLDDALSELIEHEVVRADAEHYALAHHSYAAALQAQLDPATLAARHRALAHLSEHKRHHASVVAYHLLHAGQTERALDLLASVAGAPLAEVHGLDAESLCEMLERALAVHAELRRPKRERYELMRLMLILSLTSNTELFLRFAPAFRAQLEADVGLHAYWAHSAISDPATRLRTALADASARYAHTPPHERVYTPEEALTLLAMHIAATIPICARLLDVALMRSLPGSLDPFVGLSPLLQVIRENVEATLDSYVRARPERTFARWQRSYELLGSGEADTRIATIRAALAYGLGEICATLGLSAAAMQWIERLDRDPLQRVNAMRVRRIVCLQHGDWSGAERAREQAELMALQASGPQLFEAPLRNELHAHWLARDLAGVKQVADQIGRLTPTRPGWHSYHQLAQGYFEALRGDAAAALSLFDACIASNQPDSRDPDRSGEVWLRASAGALEMLLELGRVDQARARGERILSLANTQGIAIAAQPVQCELAVAEAESGDATRAVERVEAMIADHSARGVSGLQLGNSYEARARVAIALGHEADAAHYAALAAREYRHGDGSALTSRYGRLLQAAQRAGIRLPPRAAELTVTVMAEPQADPMLQALQRTLDGAGAETKPQLALELLCKHGQAKGGYLFGPRGPGAELQLVASWQLPPPSVALTRFAAAFWQQQLDDAEMSAVITELPWARESYQAFAWTDPQAERYEAVMLVDARQRPPCVALAVLHVEARRNADRDETPGWPTALLTMLASRLSAQP